jgi:3-oxoadipate enol-lactonase
MKISTTDHIELHYSTFGDRKDTPVVSIHGLGADRYMWKPQMESLPGEGLFLIVPDMRGHGNSSSVNTFSIKDCARDISDLLYHLDCPRAVIAGVSMGGVIAQQFACDYPDQTEKLVVADSFSEVSSLSEKLGGWMQWLTMKLAPGVLIKSMEKVYKGPHMEDALQYFRESLAHQEKKQILKARAALNRFNITERLEAIATPTLVLVGDGFGKFAIQMAKKTANAIPGADFKVLQGGLDPSNMVVKEAFDREMLKFIQHT